MFVFQTGGQGTYTNIGVQPYSWQSDTAISTAYLDPGSIKPVFGTYCFRSGKKPSSDQWRELIKVKKSSLYLSRVKLFCSVFALIFFCRLPKNTDDFLFNRSDDPSLIKYSSSSWLWNNGYKKHIVTLRSFGWNTDDNFRLHFGNKSFLIDAYELGLLPPEASAAVLSPLFISLADIVCSRETHSPATIESPTIITSILSALFQSESSFR